MHLVIDPQISKDYPDFKLGVILVKNFDNSKRSSSVESLIRGACAQKIKEFSSKDINDDERIKIWNQTYGKFGTNPEKEKCMLRKLIEASKENNGINHENQLRDVINYYALKMMIPIHGHDIDWFFGDVTLGYTKGGEAFREENSIDVKDAGEGEAAYMDKGGIVERYWNSEGNERTKLTGKTVSAVVFVEDMMKMHIDGFGELLNEIATGISKYIGGIIEIYLLNEDFNELDLKVSGRTVADDSKIPQQEKVHFLELQRLKKKELSEKEGSLMNKEDCKRDPEPSSGRQKSQVEKDNEKGQQIALLYEENQTLKFEDDKFMKEKIKHLIEKAVMMAMPKIVNPDVKIQYPQEKSHGDYACSIALKLAKELGMPPMEIAQKIIKNIPTEDFETSIAGAGFINFKLKEKLLKESLKKVIKEKNNYGESEVGKEKTVVLDYSAPNIAKPLGVHHLLSTIIGQSLYNIFAFLGFKAVAVNHIGDWGTQFGKLIYAYKTWGNKKDIEKSPVSELLKLYVKFHDEAEKNKELEDFAREEFRKFEEGDKENRKLWKWFVDESLKELEKTYKHLGGIHFDYVQGESFYEDKMEDVLKEGKERNIFVRGEEGAFIVEYDDANTAPFVVQKKDGATLYSTRDFATLKYRINTFRPVRIVYVVDSSQNMHFKQLFTAAKRFPWFHDEAVHVNFGRMSMKDGKMSTRKGNVILLDEVIEEADKRSIKIIEEKNPNLKNKEEVAHLIGVGAIKYNILCQNRQTDIVFDWDKMLSLEGNSGPYLMYTYARARSILRKVEKEEDNSAENLMEKIPLADPENCKEKIKNLVSLFPKFVESISFSAQEYRPNILCNYLYELAGEFNAFYNSVPVLRAKKKTDKAFRIKIVEAASQVIKNGLNLLGIEVVEEM
ncbi:MAG: arginine--tRNA ligase [Candidatus Gracilibacteria bacterium]|jgi:arginyl-tRNA synthetase